MRRSKAPSSAVQGPSVPPEQPEALVPAEIQPEPAHLDLYKAQPGKRKFAVPSRAAGKPQSAAPRPCVASKEENVEPRASYYSVLYTKRAPNKVRCALAGTLQG